MKKLLTVVGMIVVFAAGGALATTATAVGPPSNPGSPGDECSHGNATKPCKEDPQPDHGKDCEDHGNARGNEDHCEETTDTTHTDTTDTTHTDTTDTTHTDTTHTDTTDTTHTDTTDTTHTTTTETTHTDTTETTNTESTATETTATGETPQEEPQVFTPPTKVKDASVKPGKDEPETQVAGAAQRPTTAPQAPPLTP